MTQRVGGLTVTPATLAPAFTIQSGTAWGWMSEDGVEIWRFGGVDLQRSLDDGATVDAVHTFDQSVRLVRQLANGELLVAVDEGTAAAFAGELWVSSGYDRADPTAATWSKTLTASSDGVWFGMWGVNVHGSDVYAAEYGSKAEGANARYVRHSTDNGLTWRVIYDNPGVGKHIHGVAYDPWDDLLWLTVGDSPHSAILYSTDWRGPTPSWSVATTVAQPMGVIPLEKAVLFPSDDPANGVWRWRRGTPKSSVSMAFRISEDTVLTYIGGQPFRRSPQHETLLPFFLAPTHSGRGQLLATVDGLSLFRVWRDTETYTAKGMLTAVGPTALGNYVCAVLDDRQAATSRLVITAPAWSATFR